MNRFLAPPGLLRSVWMILACASITACVSQPSAPDSSGVADDAPRPYAIHVVDHGWHTGMILPAKELQQNLPQLARRFPDVPYLEVGWGDGAFYRAERATAGLALRALLWPTESVIHVVAVPDKGERYFPFRPQEKLCLNRRQYMALVEFIVNGFALNEMGEIQPLEGGLYGDSQFYRAQGKYHLFNTCNTWLAKGLRQAGMPVTPALIVTSQNLMDLLRAQQEEYEENGAVRHTACD